jgi:tetratricopeptide (TPR) repeat protein
VQTPLTALLCLLAAVAPAAAQPAASAPTSRAAEAVGDPRPRLAVAGFEPDPAGDERDAWIAVGLEELLARRLRRVPALSVLPTLRVQQGRRELQDPDDAPPPWPAVVRGLGATFLLSGRCRGSADSVALELTLQRLDDASSDPQRVALPAARLVETLDAATRWLLSRFPAPDLDPPRAARVFAPPSRSLTAVEYYARAIAASRAEKLADARRYASQALDSDRFLRPAAILAAQLELGRGAASRDLAGRLWRTLADLALLDGDALDRAQAELGQSLILQAEGAFDAALTRAETALTIAYEQRDCYGQIAAISLICDLWLTRPPPPGVKLADPVRERFQRENLRRAAEWQHLLVEMLDGLGDRIASLPAANKLALIYERLGDSEHALEMHQRTLTLADALGARAQQATAWLFLGQYYRNRAQWREALDALSRCLALAPESARPAVRLALSAVYQGLALPEEALAQLESAYEQLRKTDDLMNQFACLREIARVRMSLGRRAQAVAALESAIDIAHALELREEQQLRTELETWKTEKP